MPTTDQRYRINRASLSLVLVLTLAESWLASSRHNYGNEYQSYSCGPQRYHPALLTTGFERLVNRSNDDSSPPKIWTCYPRRPQL